MLQRSALQQCLTEARFPNSIQTQSLALRALLALRKRKPQETQALAFVVLRENFTQQTQAPANRNARSKRSKQWQP